MKFCPNCKNLFYLSLSETDENKLQYYCRNCQTQDTTESIHVVHHDAQHEKNFNFVVNEFTIRDPTLPHLYNMKCPFENCPTNVPEKGKTGLKKTDVVYLRFDDENMSYVYICTVCQTKWKN
jgi:DNA-directed RNA polymerase subunit M/transcription elongation factor TFIIS